MFSLSNSLTLSMLEPVLLYYLNHYLGRYVEGLDRDSLRVSVWAGDVVLKDLKLRPEALQGLNLPITVRGGVLGTLRLKVPWAALGRQQVQVKIDRLYVLAVPSYMQEGSAPQDAGEEVARLAQKKRAAVCTAERQWTERMTSLDEASSVASQPGYLQGVINVVLGNLKLKITNMHVRYEDPITQPESPFACGLTLHNVGAFTVDEAGKEIFVKKEAMALLRKAAELSRFAVYFDTDSPTLWHQARDLDALSLDQWDELFLPGVSVEAELDARQYVLHPVDGNARYERRARELVNSQETPHQDIEMAWPKFALCLSHKQARSVTLLLQELSRHQLRLPHQSSRPDTRPSRTAAQLWWRYAYKAVTNQLRQGRPSWTDIVYYLRVQREYVPRYVSRLKDGLAAAQADETIARLEQDLPSMVMLHFRKLAHAQVRRRERQGAAEKSGQQGKRSWVGWALGYKTSGAGEAAEGDAAFEGEGAGQDGEGEKAERSHLTESEVQALEDMVQTQASVIESSDPLQLLTQVALTVSETSVQLVDDDGTVATLSATLMRLGLHTFQAMMSAWCSVDSMALVTPATDLIRTGALSDEESHFLHIGYTSRPHETDIDHAVKVRMAPAYVTYDIAALERFQRFFTISADDDAVDLTALGAQATTRMQEMRDIARQQVQAAWSNKPKIDVHLDLHAPKIAVPITSSHDDASSLRAFGPVTLLADLGSLVISSNHQEASTLSPEEAAMYDCYALLSSDLSMHLINGTFAWPEATPAAAEASAAAPQATPPPPVARGPGHAVHTPQPSALTTLRHEAADYLGEGAVAVPLLDHCSTSASVHMAHVSHPTLPLIRIGLQVPDITLHVSPSRLTQVLEVINTVMPATDEPVDRAPWIKAAEFTSPVDALVWHGFASASSRWERRFAVVYRGTLYLMEREGSPVIVRQIALWQQRRIVPVPAAAAGGEDHVLAVVPAHVPSSRILEEPAVLVLRLQSGYMLSEWTRRLRHSAAQMRSVAVWHRNGRDDESLQLDSSAATSSAPQGDESPERRSPTHPRSEDPSTAVPASTTAAAGTFLTVAAHLRRLSVHASCRAAEEFWPPSDVAPPPDTQLSLGAEHSLLLQPRFLKPGVTLGDERPVISIVAEGGLLSYGQALGTMLLDLKLQRFIIEDRLVGAINPQMRFLARSFAADATPAHLADTSASAAHNTLHEHSVATPSAFEGGPMTPPHIPHRSTASSAFHSASGVLPRTPSSSARRSVSGAAGQGDIEPADSDDMHSACSMMMQASGTLDSAKTSLPEETATLAGPAGAVMPLMQEAAVHDPADCLVSIQFAMRDALTAQSYANEDMSLDVSVASLYFACNRPTVAALMCFGQDIVYASAPPTPPPAATPDAHSAQLSTQLDESAGPPAQQGAKLARSGGEKRTVFRLGFCVAKLELQVAYEGYGERPFALCSVSDYDMQVHMHPESMFVTASLGNAQVQDGCLEEGNPYRQVCGLRSDTSASLIHTEFRMHSAKESLSEPRAPDGSAYYSLQAKMQAVTVVYLSRFVNEFLAYLSALFHFCPAPLPDSAAAPLPTTPPAAAGMPLRSTAPHRRSLDIDTPPEDTEKLSRVLELLGAPVLLDVEMQAPVIVMPRHSTSEDSLELDLGVLRLTNRVVATPEAMQAVDSMGIQLHEVSARVLSAAKQGDNLIQGLHEGLSLHITRALVDPALNLPYINCHIDVPRVLASITDDEYDFCCTVSLANLREPMRLPGTALWLQDKINQLSQERTTATDERPDADSATTSKQLEAPPPKAAPVAGPPVVSDVLRATLAFGTIELALHNEQAGGNPTPLAMLHASNLTICYVSDGPGAMDVRVSLPTLEAHDYRSARRARSSLVLSSTFHVAGGAGGGAATSDEAEPEDDTGLVGPSMLTVHYICKGDGSQDVALRLQRPTLVAEVDFMIAMLKFVMPSIALGADPTPFLQHDLHLEQEVTTAEDHLWLSPETRLLADHPTMTSYELDLAGNCLVLPPDLPKTSAMPLIVIGADSCLRIRNATVYNAESLPACLSLAPGARLFLEEADGNKLLDGSPTHLGDPVASMQRTFERLQGTFSAPAGAPKPQSSHFQVDLTAVGVGFHVVASSATDLSGGSKQADDTPLLAAYMDVQAAYGSSAGSKETASLCLKGLRAETQIVAGQETANARLMTNLHGGIVRQGAGITQGQLLDPVDVTAAYKNDGSKRDVAVDVTDIALHVAPDAITVVMEVSDTILKPLQAASPAQPLYAVNAYTRIASSTSKKSLAPPFAAVGAGGLDSIGEERGFTFWAPVAPPGHSVLGHVLTAGTSQPTHEVTCAALTSGIVAWPLGFDACWHGVDATVWEARPPQGYAALGCVVTTGGDAPPLHAMVCVHLQALVRAPLGQCLARSGEGSLWAVDNSAGSFVFADEENHLPTRLVYDLRTPLAAAPSVAAPAALPENWAQSSEHSTCAYATESALSSFRSYQRFQQAWSQSIHDAHARALSTTTLVFERVWTNKMRANSRQNAVSIWRPVPPAGYVAVGDCLVSGSWTAPRAATVLHVEQDEHSLVQPAVDFQRVWADNSGPGGLTIWEPVPPPGYTALGIVAATDKQRPSPRAAYCVRDDATFLTNSPALHAIQITPDNVDFFGADAPSTISLAVFDPATLAVQLQPPGGQKKSCFVLSLPPAREPIGDTPLPIGANGATQPLTVHLGTSSVCVRVRNILRVPLLDLETAGVDAECQMGSSGEMRATINFSPEVWSYNAGIKEWEPMVEKFSVRAKYQNNPAAHPIAGVEPGMAVTVETQQGVHATLSHAAMDSILRALAWWRNAYAASSDHSALYRHAAAADAAVVLTEVHNVTGEPLQMWMDMGDKTTVADIPQGTQRLMQPLVRPVARPTAAAPHGPPRLPAMLLCVTLRDLQLQVPKASKQARPWELYLTAHVSTTAPQEPGAAVRDGAQASTCTRCLRITSSDPSSVVRETFLLELPEAISRALAADVTAHVTSKRLHVASTRSKTLQQDLYIGVALHDQTVDTPVEGIVASGWRRLDPEWMHAAALHALHATEPGSTDTGASESVTLTSVAGPQSSPPHAAVPADGSVGVSAHLQRVGVWIDSTPSAHELQTSRSQRGYRSLRLASAQANWLPVVRDGMQHPAAGTGALSGSILGLDVGSGLALEESFVAGVRRETIRSTVQVANDLDFAVQVSVKLPPGTQAARLAVRQPSATLAAGSRTPSGAEQLQAEFSASNAMITASDYDAMTPEVLEDEVFENERVMPMRGFKPAHLMPLDPRRFSKRRDGSNSSADFPYVTPPKDYEWQGSWAIEKGPNTDTNGWSYAVDFSMLSYPFTSSSPSKSLTHFVRRRRWVRQRRRVAAPAPAIARRTSGAGEAPAAAPAPKPDASCVVIGVAQPGKTLAVPLHLLECSGELRVRPHLVATEDAPHHHEWSSGASNGTHSVVLNLDALEATNVRLLQCGLSRDAPAPTKQRPLSATKRAFASGNLQTGPCFISLRVDSEPLANAGPAEADWRLTLQPPLSIQNLLPVPAEYEIYERPASGSSSQRRQCGTAEAGGFVAVYSADVRAQVSLKFVPLGYQWAGRSPLPLSGGYSSHAAGVSAPKALPATFSISNANTKVPLAVHVERELSSQVPGAARAAGADPGGEVAIGCDMLVRLFVPLWVLNLTQTLVSAAITERSARGGVPTVAAARRLAYGSGSDVSEHGGAGGGGGGGARMAAALTLETVDCSRARGGTAPAAARSHCQVLPGSCELLSYAATGGLGDDAESDRETVLQVGVLGAPWSPGIVIAGGQDDTAAKKGDPVASASRSLRESRPVLLRAHVPENGVVLDVVAHLQVAPAPFQRCKVLHLTPHVVISNRTGVPVSLRQDGPSQPAPSRAPQAGIMLTAKPHGELLTASPVPEITDSAAERVLLPGMVGHALNFQSHGSRMFAIALPADARETADCTWSTPIVVSYPGTPELCISVPVTDSWVQRNLSAAVTGTTDAGARSAAAALSRRSCKSLMHSEQEWAEGDSVAVRASTVAVVRLSMQVQSPGCLHVVLHNVGGQPPFLLQNRTARRFAFRQHNTQDRWRLLGPYSAQGFSWPYLADRKKPKLEVAPLEDRSQSVSVELDDAQQHSMQRDTADSTVLLTGPSDNRRAYLLHVHTVSDGILSLNGIADVAGAAGSTARLGSTGLERTLVISDVDAALPRQPARAARLRGPSPNALSMRMHLLLGQVDFSIVDAMPEELVLAQAWGVRAEYDYNCGAASRFKRVALTVETFKVDDQLWSSLLPVALCPLPSGDRKPPPALELTALYEAAVTGGRRRVPYLTLDVPLRLQLAISEELAWRLLALYQSLPLDVLSAAPAAAADAAPSSPVVDAMLIISLLSCSAVDGTLFFRAAPDARPREGQPYVSAAALSMLPEALDSVRLRLHGREVTNTSMRASQLQAIMQEQIRTEVFNIGLGLFYGYLGYLGTSMVSQGLTAASESLKKVVGASRMPGGSSAPVSGITDGMRQGAGSAVEGLFKGLRGVVQKPVDSARSGGGAAGLLKGIGQGVAGLAAMPVAGVLDLGASTFQGVNASLTSAIHGRTCVVQRTRIQRSVAPSGAVGAWDGERALGHALLRLTMASPESRTRQLLRKLGRRNAQSKPSDQQLDCFFMLPGQSVVMLTNQCILLLRSEEFGRVFEVARVSGKIDTDELVAGELRWLVPWSNVLAPELRGTGALADHVSVHLRQPTAPLNVKCAAAQQAHRLQHAIHRHLNSLLRVRMLDCNLAGPAIEDAGLPQDSGQMLPLQMPSMDWRLVCVTQRSPRTDDVASVWRPVGVLCYACLGDVLRKGREPPSHPVTMFLKNPPATEQATPVFEFPVHYLLVWRDFSGGGLTVWRPQPPAGYQALGCLAAKGLDPPARTAVVCVREDCVTKAACWNSPTWECVSSDEREWRISCWQVDSPCGTFWAKRTHCTADQVEVYDVDVEKASNMMKHGGA